VSSRHGLSNSFFLRDLCSENCVGLLLLPSFFPPFQICYRMVRTFSVTHFGTQIIYTDFGVFSCFDDVISQIIVKVVLAYTQSTTSDFYFVGVRFLAFGFCLSKLQTECVRLGISTSIPRHWANFQADVFRVSGFRIQGQCLGSWIKFYNIGFMGWGQVVWV